jgi:hypothetical protein
MERRFLFQIEDIRMLINLRVVVTVVFVKAPKWLMVRKMKFWPTAPHMQNQKMSQLTSGLETQKLKAG